MSTYLVTGAAGFIGAALAKKLLDQNHKVVIIDNLSTGFRENIPEGCVSIIGNTHDRETIEQLSPFHFDAIFHIAGQSGGITSFDDPIYDLNSNVTSTLLLLDFAKKTGCKCFVYASSMSVYGDENPCPVFENSDKSPKTFYAVGKLASEGYMKMYSDNFGIKTTALRFNNVYGPGQNMANLRQGMVSIFLAQAISNRHVHVMGAKNRFRDFVFIDDVVNACLLSANAQEEKLFNAYNVATNTKTTVEELIETMRKMLPFDFSVEYKGSTPGDQFGIYCDYSLIDQNIGWKPQYNLEQGLKIMIDWALNLK